MSKVVKFKKTVTPEGRDQKPGEYWVNAYGTSVDEDGKPVTYLVRTEKVNQSHLEKEISHEELRLNEKKLKLAAIKGE